MLLAAARIRNLKNPYAEAPEPLSDGQVVEAVRRDFLARLSTPDEVKAVNDQTVLELQRSIEDESFLSGARELLRQADVLIWSAVEVLSNDLFIALLNTKPKLAAALLRDERTKKRFLVRDVSPILEEFGYDLSKRMGEVLLGLYRIDDVETIRVVFDVVLPDDNLRGALQRDELWKLYQRRNLIVHRRSVVDSTFVEKTGDALAIGSELVVKPAQLQTDLTLARDVGIELLRSLSRSL